MESTVYRLWGDTAILTCKETKETTNVIVDPQNPDWGSVDVGEIKQVHFYSPGYMKLHPKLFEELYPEERIDEILGD